jgi:MarR family transcriptional regulator for hemolysin
MDGDQPFFDINDSFPLLIKQCSKRLGLSLNRAFAEAGHPTTVAQWVLIVHLWGHDGVTQQELADLYDSNKVTAFRLLSRLEDQGLVERRPDPDDRRCKRVHLTPAGRALQSAVAPIADKDMAMLGRGVSEDDMQTMKRVLRIILRNAEA